MMGEIIKDIAKNGIIDKDICDFMLAETTSGTYFDSDKKSQNWYYITDPLTIMFEWQKLKNNIK